MAATPLSPHPPTSTEIALPDAVFDRLFQRYTIKLRRAGLECFIVASIMFDLWVICVPQGQSWISMGKLKKKQYLKIKFNTIIEMTKIKFSITMILVIYFRLE